MEKRIEATNKPTVSGANRIASIAIIAVLCLFCWFGVRTQIGNMLAELTPPSREDAKEMAEVAISMAPNDPRPRWLSAMVLKRSFAPEDRERSVHRLEEAVQRNPHDFRSWTDLARGYEQSERFDEAEAALTNSIKLAPTYAIPHWQMANFLLRQDRIDEAKAELERVAETNSQYRDQAYGLALDYFGKDPAVVEKIAPTSPDGLAGLAFFFARRGLGVEALRIWNLLPDLEKSKFPYIAKPMARTLLNGGFAKASLSVGRDAGIAEGVRSETVTNGGFELQVGEPGAEIFGWSIYRTGERYETQLVASEAFDGKRSVKVTFRNYLKPAFYGVDQIVVVEPGGRYRLRFMLRTENLRSAGMPFVNISAIKTRQSIANTPSFEVGSHDWKAIELVFRVPDDVEGIDIQTVRNLCGEDCGISGTLWYDDFRLERL